MKLKVYLPQSACKTIYVSITRDPEMPLLCQEFFFFLCVCMVYPSSNIQSLAPKNLEGNKNSKFLWGEKQQNEQSY